MGDLAEYRAKRDFGATPEPAAPRGSRKRAKQRDGARASEPGGRFVVHEHHARRLHWDLRLERDGALMSWAIPNGIPQEPSENRKAVHVEDHPLSYIDFEGEIPPGSYGAGRVLVWDRGSYDCEKFEDGKLVVVLHGERLRGRYALFRAGAERDWMIHRMDPPLQPRTAMPEQLAPMLAKPGSLPAQAGAWAFEIKWDGVRALTYWRPGRLRIESRNLNDISSRYPELRPLGLQLGAREAVLDGEIVAFDERGAPSFERLQKRMHLTSASTIRRLASEAPVTYVIFDLLYLDGRSTMELPYRERRALLESLGLAGASWQTPAVEIGGGAQFLEVTAQHGLEGAIAKRLDGPYRPGARDGRWLKLKNVARQELVIGGWLPGKGKRAGQIGALLMGYYEGEGARRVLRYAGRVGTGFDEAALALLGAELERLTRPESAFAKHGMTPPRESRFVEPELVAEVEFSHWTRDRILRHSVYKGLRADKPAREVELERVPGAADGPAQTRPSRRARPARSSPLDARTPPAHVSRGDDSLGDQSAPEGSSRPELDPPYQVLRETKRHAEIEVQGRQLRLSNRQKLLYPGVGFTKGELVDYYAAVAPVLLPHLAGRPVTLKRYPDGVEQPYFYEKRCPTHRPEWVATAAVRSERLQESIEYCLIEDSPTLIWTANLAAIELHPSLSLARAIETPTALVFDLDPGAPAGLRACCRVALWIKELFDAFGLQSVAKTSGAKGLQVYVPLNTPTSYEQTKPFARAVAELLEHEHPKLVVSRMRKGLRAGRVLIDWSQNDPHKTTVCVYSLRARERPTISTPLTWEEVQRAARRRSEPRLSLEPRELLEQVQRHGDRFAALLGLSQWLPSLSGSAASEFYESPQRGSSTGEGIDEQDTGGAQMPPSGVKKGSKRERQYEHIKDSERERGVPAGRAREIAARTVNKERARSGESATSSRTSTQDISSGRRGGKRSGKPGPRGRTRDQLYQEARKLGVEGRSSMNKAQLQRAVEKQRG